MWVILLVAIGVGAYFVWQNPKFRENLRDYISSQSGENAIDILKKRYAQGEISKEEFEAMKKDLEN
ncbi:MAG: SHOCT domain-containing protein [Desulfoferrobacter sp.]